MHPNQPKHNAASVDTVKVSLSPTHICKLLTNVRGGSSGQRIANTHFLAHYNIAFSQWPCLASLLNISSFPSPWLMCWTHKHMQTRTEKNTKCTHTHTHLCAQTYSTPTKAQSPETYTSLMFLCLLIHIMCWCYHCSLYSSYSIKAFYFEGVSSQYV